MSYTITRLKNQYREGNSLRDCNLPEKVNQLELFSFTVPIHTVKGKQKRIRNLKYYIELHHFSGFAMIKFYPGILKKHPKKYQIRFDKNSKTPLSYPIGPATFRKILFTCIEIMVNYLNQFPDNFIGYVGQPDKYDDGFKKSRSRLNSQRYSIYSPFFEGAFSDRSKYIINAPEIFEIVNIRLVTRRRIKNSNQLNNTQSTHYEYFKKLLLENPKLQEELTTKTRYNYEKKRRN